MKLGSSYEAYEKTHAQYDKTRLPVGSEQLIDFIQHHFSERDDLSALRILDAGCGTGGHLTALAQAGFTSLTGLDASCTGLAQAALKLNSISIAAQSAQTLLINGDIRAMPFAPQSFDLILFSFVLHHLPHDDSASLLKATESLLAHSATYLAPGGVLAIITCTPAQMSAEEGCMWYYKYFPEAAARLASRFLPAPQVLAALNNAGLSHCLVSPVNRTYWTEASLDPNGPQDSNWRSGDSLFALCQQKPELFTSQLQKLENDVTSGVAQEHIKAVRARAEEIKQAIMITAHK